MHVVIVLTLFLKTQVSLLAAIAIMSVENRASILSFNSRSISCPVCFCPEGFDFACGSRAEPVPCLTSLCCLCFTCASHAHPKCVLFLGRFPVAKVRPCTPLCTGQLDRGKGDRDLWENADLCSHVHEYCRCFMIS